MRVDPIFKDPPPPGDDDPWRKTVDMLIARSGEWALVFSGRRSSAGALKSKITRRQTVWRGHDWEVQGRDNGDVHEVYVRHIRKLGAPDEAAEPPGGGE